MLWSGNVTILILRVHHKGRIAPLPPLKISGEMCAFSSPWPLSGRDLTCVLLGRWIRVGLERENPCSKVTLPPRFQSRASSLRSCSCLSHQASYSGKACNAGKRSAPALNQEYAHSNAPSPLSPLQTRQPACSAFVVCSRGLWWSQMCVILCIQSIQSLHSNLLQMHYYIEQHEEGRGMVYVNAQVCICKDVHTRTYK